MAKLKVLFLYPNLMLQTGFPMAICIFSALLKKEGFDVDIFDTTFYRTEEVSSDQIRMENLQVKPFDLGDKFKNLRSKQEMFKDLTQKIESYKPDLIAISILEDLFPLSVEMFSQIEHFDIPVIAGGVFPTFAPEKVISEKAVDMVCIGEGEDALVELCHKLADKQDISRIKNLWIKKGNQIIKNELCPVRDINLNPLPDFTIFHSDRFLKIMKGKLLRMAPVETHRGCPYSCGFCNSRSQRILYKQSTGESFLRIKDVSNIYKELKMLVDQHNVEYIYFPADTFLAMGSNYLKEFVEMYRKIALPFYCQTRPETMTAETVKSLEEMGCHSISIGIEHGNQEFRYKILKRYVSNQAYIDGICAFKNSKIMVTVNNIIGFPDETRELAFDTIALNKKLKVYAHNAYYFTPYHGTLLRDYCVEKKYLDNQVQTVHITKGSILNMPQFIQQEIKGLIRTFTLYTRLPEHRYSEISIAEKFDQTGNRKFKELQNEYWSKFF